MNAERIGLRPVQGPEVGIGNDPRHALEGHGVEPLRFTEDDDSGVSQGASGGEFPVEVPVEIVERVKGARTAERLVEIAKTGGIETVNRLLKADKAVAVMFGGNSRARIIVAPHRRAIAISAAVATAAGIYFINRKRTKK